MSAVRSFAVTTQNFQREVMERSADVPVLLEFWANWCGPCKSLAPILDRVAAEYGGSFVLARVDSEEQRELAAAFRVQSIPFAALLVGGRPVDAFSGALTEADLRSFLSRNGVEPVAPKEPVPDDPESPTGGLLTARRRAAAGDAGGARAALAAIPVDDELYGEREHLETGLEFLEAELPADRPAAEHLRQARERLLAGDLEAALSGLVAAAAEDRGFGGGLARKGMLLCQSLHGADHELVDAYRRRLATVLY